MTSDLEVTVQVIGPRRKFGEIETLHYWEVAVEGERLSISGGGHFFQPSTGGDSFTTMTWAAIPEEVSDLDDYRQSLWMVPDVLSFPDADASIDFATGGYKIEVIDEDNPLLEDDEDSDEEGSDGEPGDEDDEELSGNSDTLRTWSLSPIDALEERLASTVNADDVDSNEPGYAYGVENCHFCGCPLNRRGMFVDGWLRGHLTTGNMCAICFDSKGEGIGWGKGQLYARQPDGSWRRVAGGRSSDAGASFYSLGKRAANVPPKPSLGGEAIQAGKPAARPAAAAPAPSVKPSLPVVIQCGDGQVFQFPGEKEAQQFETSVKQAGGETFRLVPALPAAALPARSGGASWPRTAETRGSRWQALMQRLCQITLGDAAKIERLIEFEREELQRKALPEEAYESHMERAIERWERENAG